MVLEKKAHQQESREQNCIVRPPVFVTGGTGYIGQSLIKALLERGFSIHALVRPGSEARLPHGALPVIGNALDPSSFAPNIPSGATLIHLVGTPHPSPAKAAEFQRVDLGSIRATTIAAQHAGVRHLIYVSVAHPAPVMQAYIAARREGEALVNATGIPATVLRPWYVLGPGHRWPYLLMPFYAVLSWVPATRDGTERLGLVTLRTMVSAMVGAVETPPPTGVRILGVPEIRRAGTQRL
jgi:uncharacterized protein YbjT (DUF2867 family)